mgnify:CR=1 FL=1
MKRFEFNLQALLDKRNREEEEIKLELAQNNNRIQVFKAFEIKTTDIFSTNLW